MRGTVYIFSFIFFLFFFVFFCVGGGAAVQVWRLDEIAEALRRGALVDFSAAELGHLLEALFEDGDKLRRLLAAVRQA